MSVLVVRIRLLGEPIWHHGETPLPALNALNAAMLALLVLEGAQPRNKLLALLFPEDKDKRTADPVRLRSDRLRTRAKRLRADSGVHVIRLGDPVCLAANSIEVDVADLAGLDTPTLLASRQLLAGVDVGDNADLDAWLVAARADVDSRIARILAARARLLDRSGQLDDALPLARRVTELDVLNEPGWYLLMSLLYRLGDHAGVEEAYFCVVKLLRDEYARKPCPEIEHLMQILMAADSAPHLPSHVVPASVLKPPRMIGRDSDYRSIGIAWQRGQSFLLVGDVGIGKSRLLEKFAGDQTGVILESALDTDADQPYALLLRLRRRIAAAFTPQLAADSRAELDRIDPATAPKAAPAHDSVVQSAIEALLAAAAARGLAGLLVDNLHKADAASIAAMRMIDSRASLSALRWGGAALLSLPDGLTEPLAQWLRSTPAPVQVDLLPLGPGELTELLASLALPRLIDADIVDQLYRHAGGNVMYTLATLQDAIESGIDLHARDLPRPRSVQALISKQLRSLPPDAQRLLQVAAVAGDDLRADRVAQLLGKPLLSLIDTWGLLEGANVLRGERFSHELYHHAALETVPPGLRQALHRQLAELLAGDGTASPARLARHWEGGERWSEAGHAWHAAADAARRAGRLAEAATLFNAAAANHALAGDDAARFEALHARLGGLELEHGGKAVLAAMPTLEELAITGLQRLRCSLARAAAWIDIFDPRAAGETASAVREAALHPRLLADALSFHAQALAQAAQDDAALATAREALQAARAAADRVQELRALESISFVHFSAGRLHEAVEWQRRVVAHAEGLSFRAEAAIGEGNVAAQLAAAGDVPTSHTHALRAHDRHREIGLAEGSTVGIANYIVIGVASASLGLLDAAIGALTTAVALAGTDAAAVAQAKSRITLGNLWLVLGRADEAFAAVASVPADIAPGMQVQLELLRARSAEHLGMPATRWWQALRRLADEHPALPLVQSAHLEASWGGDPSAVVAALEPVRRECQTLGLHGMARALQWRELARWLDIPGRAATLRVHELALALMDHATNGLSAKCHPPQVLLTLWRAFGHLGDAARQSDCRRAALAWIDHARANLAEARWPAFSTGHPVHRWWQADDPGPPPADWA